MKDQKIIVFDSHDCSGKTNMAIELSSRTGIPYFKNKFERRFFSEPDAFYYDFKYAQSYIVQFLEQTKYSVILDRSWFSQRVYSIMTSRKYSQQDWEDVDEAYSLLNTYVLVPFKTDVSKVVDDIWSNHEIERQRDLYEETFNLSKCHNKIMFCVDDENLEQEMNMIMDFIK